VFFPVIAYHIGLISDNSVVIILVIVLLLYALITVTQHKNIVGAL